MSDFIYSSLPKSHGKLAAHIQSIYHNDPPDVFEYHGEWGSLGVSRNLYNGFQPLETDDYIFVVIGGPVLCFQTNLFLTGNDPLAGTKAFFERWQVGSIQCSEDLSGPFAVLVVDKLRQKISCITDMMMFIPVYKYLQDGALMLGTHVDALARASNEEKVLDLISATDFILNDVVTYPYTMYQNIKQMHPAAEQGFAVNGGSNVQEFEPNIYWLPIEENPYPNIRDAAQDLREGLLEYVHRITENMEQVAQFISAGEDSRAVAGMIPQRLKRNAYIFLDFMNREGRIACKVAHVYGANFYPKFRHKEYYLDIFEAASELIGSGYQFTHAHTLGFYKSCVLDKFFGVFGGYMSDGLFKAMYIRKIKGQGFFPFIPQIYISGECRSKPLINKGFKKEVLHEISTRHRIQLERLQKIRTKTLHEWFAFWPATVKTDIPYYYANRRLFRTYEPFMCKQAVKLCAAAPISWKLNRRLFNKAFRPCLKPSRWIFHSDGRLPYYPWWTNIPIQASIWFGRKIGYWTGIIKGNQGPWGDWEKIIGSKKWQNTIQSYANGFEEIKSIVLAKSVEELFYSQKLNRTQKINFVQMIRFLS